MKLRTSFILAYWDWKKIEIFMILFFMCHENVTSSLRWKKSNHAEDDEK